jgi:hypothetical protein
MRSTASSTLDDEVTVPEPCGHGCVNVERPAAYGATTHKQKGAIVVALMTYVLIPRVTRRARLAVPLTTRRADGSSIRDDAQLRTSTCVLKT